MANYFYKGKEVRSRSDRDRDVKLSWAHTVTLKHTDINFREPYGFCSYEPECKNYGKAMADFIIFSYLTPLNIKENIVIIFSSRY